MVVETDILQVSNYEISRYFNLLAELLLLHEKDERLAALLSGAGYRLRNIAQPVTDLPKKELSKLFRPEIIQLIGEIKNTGTIAVLEELIQLTPAGLFEMMRIKGLGGKKLAVLWNSAGIDSIDALLTACKQNEISQIQGFGNKSQQNIINSIEAYNSSKDRFHYASVADQAALLVQNLQRLFKTKLISLCGEVRRQTNTVDSIEIIAAMTAKKFNDKAIRKFLIVQSHTNTQTHAHTLDEIPVLIYHTTKDRFHYELFLRTGNEGHVKKVLGKTGAKKKFSSEQMLYKEAGLPFIEPEMREDVAEWKFIKKRAALVTLEDIKGVVHNHTTWSDGIDSLEDLVQACIVRNYEYAVISDHSKNAYYARGLKEGKVLRQLDAINKLNKKVAPFRIFKSIECDILVSGELDYSPDILALFDLVIVSVHQLLKMDEQKATNRLIKAIENPYTTILGHMTGRQLLIRPGYPVNFKKVIDACAANNVVIEINANPYRLDMDWAQIPYALGKGVMIAIDPDAHSIAEIDNIKWGVASARKGGLTRNMTWNAMTRKSIEQWLRSRR